jgi:hypothetical protein
MRKQRAWGSIFIWLALTVTGCAAVAVYSSSPAVQKMSNDYFSVELEPQHQEGQNFFTSFRFVFTNKTKKDLHVDWENTFYLVNGRRSGRFLWEGVDWEALKKIRNLGQLQIVGTREAHYQPGKTACFSWSNRVGEKYGKKLSSR